MGTDMVRRGGTRGVRMNGHLCLAEEWLEQEGGKESAEPGKDELVLDLGKQWTCIPTALAFPRLTISNATQAIIQVHSFPRYVLSPHCPGLSLDHSETCTCL